MSFDHADFDSFFLEKNKTKLPLDIKDQDPMTSSQNPKPAPIEMSSTKN